MGINGKDSETCMRKMTFLIALLLMLVLGLESASAAIWFGEDNGSTLHRDPYCARRQMVMLQPFAHAVSFADLNALEADGSRQPCDACGVEVYGDPSQPLPEELHLWWNADLVQKAEMLPGVWTLPPENAVSPEEALQTAKSYAASVPDFARHMDQADGQPLCTGTVFHYDTCTAGADQRQAYKVLVTTPKLESICIVYVDALTGQVYGVAVMLDPALLAER